jgi:UDP-N-acetylglucosamine:LPS N-acetylglucosamine transferase
MEKKKKVFLLITDAGAGHRASAMSLMAWAEAAGKPWDMRIINVYREIWQEHEPFKRFFGFYAEDAYNFVLKNQLQVWTPLMRKAAIASSRLPQKGAVNAGAEFLRREKPDLCISLMPFVNDRFAQMHADAGVPFAVVCTDLMDTLPYMWFTPLAMKQALFVCTGSPEAALQARESGGGDRVVESGLVIHPKYFREDLQRLSRAEARERFELEAKRFTVAIVMGGYGGTVIREFVENLEASGGGWQIVACCGNNEKLRLELDALRPGLKNKVLALGFSTQIPALMRAADLLITKPGPATLMEALAVGVPLALDDVNTMSQEIPNADWAESQSFAVGVKKRAKIFETVNRFQLDPSLGEEMRAAQRSRPLAPAGPVILGAIESCLSSFIAS